MGTYRDVLSHEYLQVESLLSMCKLAVEVKAPFDSDPILYFGLCFVSIEERGKSGLVFLLPTGDLEFHNNPWFRIPKGLIGFLKVPPKIRDRPLSEFNIKGK